MPATIYPHPELARISAPVEGRTIDLPYYPYDITRTDHPSRRNRATAARLAPEPAAGDRLAGGRRGTLLRDVARGKAGILDPAVARRQRGGGGGRACRLVRGDRALPPSAGPPHSPHRDPAAEQGSHRRGLG